MDIDKEILSSMRETLINILGVELFEKESKCVHRWLITAQHWLYLRPKPGVKINIFKFGFSESYTKITVNEAHSFVCLEKDISYMFNVKEDS